MRFSDIKGLIEKGETEEATKNFKEWKKDLEKKHDPKELPGLIESLGKRRLISEDRREAMGEEFKKWSKGLDYDKIEEYTSSRGVKKGISILDIFKKQLMENAQDSNKVFHWGGLVTKTGPAFLQKGEVVVPEYASGGLVAKLAGGGPGDGSSIKDVMKHSNNQVIVPIMKVDASELSKVVKELQSVKLQIEKDVKIGIDTEGISVPVATEGLSIPVDMPSDVSFDVKISNANDAADVISSKIKDAVSSADIKISGDVSAVGAEKN